ncbi:hypothetical protein CKAH01_10962 [Colletotrichum kahawae]|uniref:Uncharacterized protein n=1 Tax=Colletotrichum kahawae TaxID=34407 RepID=A0AAE0CWT0_COLKA|nr:hypothetical protein CKAH01_10962 [Colletotrichum kahawae]
MRKYKDGGRLEGMHLANTSNGQDVVRLHRAAGQLDKGPRKDNENNSNPRDPSTTTNFGQPSLRPPCGISIRPPQGTDVDFGLSSESFVAHCILNCLIPSAFSSKPTADTIRYPADVAKSGIFTAFSQHKSFRFARVCRARDFLQKPFGGGVSEFDVLRNAFWAAVPQAFRMRVAKYGPEAARGSQSSWRGWRGISRQQAGANDSKPAFRGLMLRRPKYDMASYPSHKPQTPQPPPPIPINDGDDDQGGATRDY